MSQASDTAAWRFLEAVAERPFPPEAISCAKAAFLLYEHEWNCHSHHIRDWRWPIDEAGREGAFEGSNEPWAVLLRQSVQLIRAAKVAVEVRP